MEGTSVKKEEKYSNLVTLVTIQYMENSEMLTALMEAIENGLIDY